MNNRGVLVIWERKRFFRVSKYVRWLKRITKGHRNMKGFEVETMAFYVGITFGFPTSLSRGNVA